MAENEKDPASELKPADEKQPAEGEAVSAQISKEHPPEKETEAESRYQQAAAAILAKRAAQAAEAQRTGAAAQGEAASAEAVGPIPASEAPAKASPAEAPVAPVARPVATEEGAAAVPATPAPAAVVSPPAAEPIPVPEAKSAEALKMATEQPGATNPSAATKTVEAAAKPAAKPAAAKPAAAAGEAKPKPAAKPKKEEIVAPEREPDEFVKNLAAAYPEKVKQTFNRYNENNIVVTREGYHSICRTLRDDPQLRFDYLALLTGVHYTGAEARFEVVLDLYSMHYNRRCRVKVKLDVEDPVVDSVCGIWPTANWHEREAYDMLGIRFRGHPDLRRILMPDYWTGYPLRKDYPWRGYRDKDEQKLRERIAEMPLTLDELPEPQNGGPAR